eukprot:7362112-Alexandrium_andersonii.AAC.1
MVISCHIKFACGPRASTGSPALRTRGGGGASEGGGAGALDCRGRSPGTRSIGPELEAAA